LFSDLNNFVRATSAKIVAVSQTSVQTTL